MSIALAALVAVGCSGGDSPGVEQSDSNQSAATSATADSAGGGPTTSAASATTAPTATSTTFPADGVGVASVAMPDPAALVLDEAGLPVPGDQLLVAVADGYGADAADAAAAAVGGEVVGQIELIGTWQVRIPPTDLAGLDAAVAAAGAVDGIDLALRNEISTLDEEIWGTAVSALDDPVYAGPNGDGYRMIGVERAWQYLRGAGLALSPVHVGIVDTGVWAANGEFDGVTLDEPAEGVGVVAAPNDVVAKDANGHPVVTGSDPGGGHGTGVAAIIGADGDDGGTVGVASAVPDLTLTSTNFLTPPYGTPSTVVPANVADDAVVVAANGFSYTTGNFQAIAEQVRRGARVINMSWGNSRATTPTARLYRRFFEQMAARHPDVLFVASAGNDGTSLDGDHRFPSGLNLPNMVTVGNLRNDGTTDPSSNTSSANFEVTLAAPGEQAVKGVDVNGTVIDDTYSYPGGVQFGGGTSMATPQVTAAAALVLAANPDLTAAQVKELLASTARTSITRPDGTEQPIGPGVGAGVLAVDEAVAAAIALRRVALGLEPADLGTEMLAQLGSIEAVAISGTGDDWTVTGIVHACLPPCTDVTIELQGEGAIGGSVAQHLDAAGQVAWTATLPKRPVTLVVRRSDNGAASRILIPELPIDGHWTGPMSLDYATGRGAESTEPWPVYATFDLRFTADGAGGVTCAGAVTLAFNGSVTDVTCVGIVSGTHLSLTVSTASPMAWEGTVTRATTGETTAAGTWTAGGEGWTEGGTWTLTRVGD